MDTKRAIEYATAMEWQMKRSAERSARDLRNAIRRLEEAAAVIEAVAKDGASTVAALDTNPGNYTSGIAAAFVDLERHVGEYAGASQLVKWATGE